MYQKQQFFPSFLCVIIKTHSCFNATHGRIEGHLWKNKDEADVVYSKFDAFRYIKSASSESHFYGRQIKIQSVSESHLSTIYIYIYILHPHTKIYMIFQCGHP